MSQIGDLKFSVNNLKIEKPKNQKSASNSKTIGFRAWTYKYGKMEAGLAHPMAPSKSKYFVSFLSIWRKTKFTFSIFSPKQNQIGAHGWRHLIDLTQLYNFYSYNYLSKIDGLATNREKPISESSGPPKSSRSWCKNHKCTYNSKTIKFRVFTYIEFKLGRNGNKVVSML